MPAQLFVPAPLDDAEQRLGGGLRPPVRHLRAARPAEREPVRLLGLLTRGGVGETFVQRMDDVGAKRLLDLDRQLGGEEPLGAVDRRAEPHAIRGNLPELGQAEHLEAAGVGQDGAVPRHEAMEPAEVAHQLVARAQEEVVRVREDDLGAGLPEVGGGEALHGAARADGYERRRIDHSVRRLEAAAARGAVGHEQLESHRRRRAESLHTASPRARDDAPGAIPGGGSEGGRSPPLRSLM